ncbi:MAG: prolyl oligopeptidase family serine peptidase [Steroidobacteraceae bacterium]|nr:S9 family peptidase [Steroidobacteraceae bacterium]MBP7012864.1 S9 family peptidase [Steroidobacteraceae bacterium]
MKFALAVVTAVALAPPLLAEQAADPFGWLEDIEGAKALDWARAENARTLPVLEGDPRFAQMRAEARSILTAPTRIPTGSIHNGAVYNFWQDDTHLRGIWRRASVVSYRTGRPVWETLIDFDRLARDEGENWVSGQVACLSPEYRLCMVEMSRGGSDSSTWREFDTTTRAFVSNGFAVPEAKSDVAWVDADTLLVGTDWGAGSMTASGYPRIVKVWRRGKPLAAASALFEGRSTDVAVRSFVDQNGGAQPFVVRAVSFFEAEYHYAPGLGTPAKLPLPLHSNIEGVLDGRAIFTLREAWDYQGKTYPQGSIVAYDLQRGTAEPVFAANGTQSVETVAVGRTGLVVQYLEDVSGKAVRVLRTPQGEWRTTPIALPANGVLKIASAGGGTDDAMLSFESLTSPLTLYYVSANDAIEQIFTTPAAYDATDVVVEQRFATSTDGTRIPYFVMGRKSVLARGNAPTVQYAYGGFLAATLPVYYEDPSRPQHGALAGKLWVSRGGVLVLANIRGGSEYGPRWHDAGLKENRQKVFDDFIAVSEDLIRTGVTTKAKLGAIGRSNGGLLMGVVMNQRPDLYAAIVNGVPLLDMQRYTKLGAGASWVAEYGDPDTADWSYLSKWSPYQNLRADVAYPPVFYYTSTKDDRVHPGHARKAAAKLKSFGRDYFYYENMEGGHGGTSNQDQLAYRIALEYAYFARRLMGAAP